MYFVFCGFKDSMSIKIHFFLLTPVDASRTGRSERVPLSSELQHDQLSREEIRKKMINESVNSKSGSNGNVTEIATITGSCLAVIVLFSTVGSVGFIMYR